MKKSKKIIIIILSIILLIALLIFIIVKTAKIEVTLVDNLKVEFNEEKKVSDFITSINGKIKDDFKIDTTKLGKQEITFKFTNNQHIRVKYSFEIEIVDTVPPLIWLGGSYSVKKDSDIDLTKKILCGDNYDSKPNCYIEGDYDLSKTGKYNLVFKATDNSGNTSSQPFVLNVYEPKKTTDKSSTTEPVESFVAFNDIVNTHKSNETKIGIDVSNWQGDIDFDKIKQAGVEFIIIRVGTGGDGEYKLDARFEHNIEEANKYGIDVGIYFYSYSSSVASAKEDAKWVLDKIKKYNVSLPIAFDWEEWNDFNSYNLSFFKLTSMADEFVNTVKKDGYQGMLYSSKKYLENIWLKNDNDIWLAHYTDQTDYDGNYLFWQLCSDGKIDGIDGYVDIDVMYKK